VISNAWKFLALTFVSYVKDAEDIKYAVREMMINIFGIQQISTHPTMRAW